MGWCPEVKAVSDLGPLVASSRLTDPLWPKLQTLMLHGVCVAQDDLLNVMRAHQHSLERVHLFDIRLMPRRYSNNSTPCWVKIFEDMRAMLRLKALRIAGWLTNSGCQTWYVPPVLYPAAGRLKARVIRHVLRDTNKNPLWDERVRWESSEDEITEAETPFEGDWTWVLANYDPRSPIPRAEFSGNSFFAIPTPAERTQGDVSVEESPTSSPVSKRIKLMDEAKPR